MAAVAVDIPVLINPDGSALPVSSPAGPPSYLEATATESQYVEAALHDLKLSKPVTRHHHAIFSLDVDDDGGKVELETEKGHERADDTLVRVVSAVDVESAVGSSSSASLSALSFASSDDLSAPEDEDSTAWEEDELAGSCLTVGPAQTLRDLPPPRTTWQQRASALLTAVCDAEDEDEAGVEFGLRHLRWSWTRARGFDLSRGEADVQKLRRLETSKGDVTVSTDKTALVVVDMQVRVSLLFCPRLC